MNALSVPIMRIQGCYYFGNTLFEGSTGMEEELYQCRSIESHNALIDGTMVKQLNCSPTILRTVWGGDGTSENCTLLCMLMKLLIILNNPYKVEFAEVYELFTYKNY